MLIRLLPFTKLAAICFINAPLLSNNFMVAEKYQTEVLDEVIPYMFTYITKPTPVELRLIKGKNGNQYLLAKNA